MGRTDTEVAAREAAGGVANGVDRVDDRAAQPQAGEDGDRSGGRRHGEDLLVVAHVEHHPAGQQDDSQRQADGERRQPGDLQADGGQRAERDRQDEADGKRCGGNGDCGQDHGTSL